MTNNTNDLSATYRFEHLTDFSPDALRQIGEIYNASFPAYERKPYWMLSDGMQHGRYSVFVVRQAGLEANEIIAFALLVKLPTSGAMYIEYLAVSPALRSQGIGSLLLRSTITFMENTPAAAIVWEVDPPEKDGDEGARRIRFYERFGAHLIEQSKHYAMPNYLKGSGTVPFRLMWKPLHGDHDQPSKSELIAFIRDIYEVEYPRGEAVRDEIIANLDKP